ncbi:hypothetical protein JY465_04490 [Stenotrophomonas maltophilia]|nr:hypothetical protein [Stenotrophomonas maltophilia]
MTTDNKTLAAALPDIESWSKGYKSGYARAVADLAARQPVGQIPAGFALVPEKFGIPADVWEGVEFVIGGPGTGEGEAYLDSTAWIGDLMQDDGSSIYGLHLSCDECPEEGSVTLVEFASPPAQAVDLGQLPLGIRLIEIPGRNGLDPINVFVQDYQLGRGRIVVTCYGQAWCGFWGAMGDRTVMQFVATCDADYVAGNMLSGRHEYVKKHERSYVERIATEVIAEFRALIDSQAVQS